MDQMNLQAWVDRTEVVHGGISAQRAGMIHAVLGRDGETAPVLGQPTPALWHWYAFPPLAGMHELRQDGHPQNTDFMPPLRQNRRMWAGGKLYFVKPLHIGETVERRTRIADIAEKKGGAGEMVVVSLEHEIHGAQGLAVWERQNIVYLDIPDSYTPPKAIPAPEGSDSHRDVAVSTPLLFRYSAITFNAHRIHYDLPFAQEVERYPGLVVHGPMQANLLIEQATHLRGKAPSSFSYRGVHPLFVQDQLSLVGNNEDNTTWALSTVANGTHQCMQATATWEE
jgi:3-methylfumaryl-CoA hydratase